MPETRSRINLLGCCLVAAVMLLSGCVSHNRAPVRDLERPQKVTWGRHVVQSGDTLYSIAWRYGRDYQELAAINGIRSPYLLKPGQIIRLSDTRVTKPAAPVAKPVPRQTKTSQKSREPVKVAVAGPVQWQWPLRGNIIGQFSNWGHNKGIDIAAPKGTAVRAAAAGIVVYAGNGLIGYGNLIIIKHSEVYLSAYAHNDKILVTEKKNVKAGQKIAEIGSTGSKKTMLHFEIRKSGKPVDPLHHLPK